MRKQKLVVRPVHVKTAKGKCVVVDGHARIAVAKQLGITNIPIKHGRV